jgi:aminomethyltransferase
MADDAIVANTGGNEWMIVHGSGDTMALLTASAKGRNVDIAFTDALHGVSVQGPQALAILNGAGVDDLDALPYFHHRLVRLYGHACRISRTGYSGERGYEIFADAAVVGDIWDQLIGAGVMPCSFSALDKLRIEAGLLFYGYDMTDANTPWEVGLGFTVSKAKGDFRGKAALMQAHGHEKVRNVGLVSDDELPGGAVLSLDGAEVGVINSPCHSHRMHSSLALAHIAPRITNGTILTFSATDGVTNSARVAALPFYDREKSKTHQ